MGSETQSTLSVAMGASMALYVAFMFGLSVWAQRRVKTREDFLVAGRRLPLFLAGSTLLATWFGAGTLLTATDEVAAAGLQRAALDPFGAGFCLVLAGLFYARPLWRMKLLTLSDFFARKYGPAAERLSAILMVPSYFGWIAAQYVALAGVLNMFFGLPLEWGILAVALTGIGYTMLGGMWSVTLTDAVQMSLVVVGVVVLAVTVLLGLGQGDVGAGVGVLITETPSEMLRPIPTGDLRALVGWLGIFAVGALGNIPGQDLMQRVFAAKSEQVAARACVVAGVIYLTFGVLPMLLALAGNLLLPAGAQASVLPLLAKLTLNPWMAVLFVLAVASAVLSTIDSAILSPATVLSQNLLGRLHRSGRASMLIDRTAVLVVGGLSLAFAYAGESAYALLESAYEVTLVSLFVPLTLGLLLRRPHQGAAIAAMASGMGAWLVHQVAGWESFLAPLGAGLGLALPTGLCCAALALVVQLGVGRLVLRGCPPPDGQPMVV